MRKDYNYIDFFDLPDIVIEKTLGYLSYEEIAHLRIVCHQFNHISQMLLNKGFKRVEKYQAKCLKEVKSQLPRRESERRNHPLFRHCDILTAVETRLSLLNMTFNKYIDCQMCCFIPGKVIDEIYRVLRFIQSNKTLPKAQEILTELRDISSMAMEHFEEKIVRSLKPTSLCASSRLSPPAFATSLPSLHISPRTSTTISLLSKSQPGTSTSSAELQQIIVANKFTKNTLNLLRKDFNELRNKLPELRRKVSEQERVALEQNRLLTEQSAKMSSQETKITDLNRKLLEYDQRFSELQAEMTRIREGCGMSSGSGTGKSKPFYPAASQSTSTVASTLFVAANMVPSNLVPVPIATTTQLPPPVPLPAFLTSPQLVGHPPGGIAFSMGAPTSACQVTTTDDCANQDPIASTSSQDTEDGGGKVRSHNKKHMKRKALEDEGEGEVGQTNQKWIKSERP